MSEAVGAHPTGERAGREPARVIPRLTAEPDARPAHGMRRAQPNHGMNAFDAVVFAMAQPVEHGLPQKAVEIARPFGFPITNSMVVTWIVAIGLIVFAQLATRPMTRRSRRRTEFSRVADREPLRPA